MAAAVEAGRKTANVETNMSQMDANPLSITLVDLRLDTTSSAVQLKSSLMRTVALYAEIIPDASSGSAKVVTVESSSVG